MVDYAVIYADIAAELLFTPDVIADTPF